MVVFHEEEPNLTVAKIDKAIKKFQENESKAHLPPVMHSSPLVQLNLISQLFNNRQYRNSWEIALELLRELLPYEGWYEAMAGAGAAALNFEDQIGQALGFFTRAFIFDRKTFIRDDSCINVKETMDLLIEKLVFDHEENDDLEGKSNEKLESPNLNPLICKDGTRKGRNRLFRIVYCAMWPFVHDQEWIYSVETFKYFEHLLLDHVDSSSDFNDCAKDLSSLYWHSLCKLGKWPEAVAFIKESFILNNCVSDGENFKKAMLERTLELEKEWQQAEAKSVVKEDDEPKEIQDQLIDESHNSLANDNSGGKGGSRLSSSSIMLQSLRYVFPTIVIFLISWWMRRKSQNRQR